MAELKMDNNDGNTVRPDPLYFFLEPQIRFSWHVQRPALMVKRPDATTILRPETRRENFAFASSAGKLNRNIRLTP